MSRLFPRATATVGALSLIGVGLAATPAGATVNDDGTVTLDVVGITDFHGALPTAPEIGGRLDAIRAENPDTVLVSSGDNIGGSAYVSAIQDDNPTIAVLNALGLEASAVGNHEFDRGYADLAARIAGTDPALTQAQFPYLGANVEGEDPELEAYHLWESPSGVSVAFVGTVTEETESIVDRSGIEGITFADPVAATNDVAADLSDGDETNGEADVVVALLHEGTHVVEGFSADVDAVFAGHSHQAQEGLTTPSGAPVVQAGASGTHLARATLTVAADGTVTGTGSVVAVDGTGPTDADLQTLVDEAQAQADVLGQEPVGTVTAPINAASNTGAGSGAATPTNRGTESPLGNLLAEVARWTAERIGAEPDFGIINPGGVRADLDPDADGTVTYAEAFGAQPFGNTIGTVDLTGEQVVTLLEQQWNADQTASRPILRLGLSPELEYVYDPAGEPGARVRAVYLDGEPLDPSATYTVASNTFLLGGQDGFTVLAEGTGFTETGIVDLQSLVDYLGENPDLAPDYGQRSVGVTGPAEAAPGDTVTLEVSSLAFTTDEPAPEEVTLTLGGTELASAPVDTTIVPDRDETGTAELTFDVPADAAPGAQALVLTTAYTEIAVPFTVTEPAAAPATVELDVRPDALEAGDRLRVRGSVTSEGADRLTGAVQVLVDGEPVGAALELRRNGSFRTELGTRGWSVGEHTVEAVYTSDDASVADGSASATVTVVEREQTALERLLERLFELLRWLLRR